MKRDMKAKRSLSSYLRDDAVVRNNNSGILHVIDKLEQHNKHRHSRMLLSG